jgi:hypothetical protein
MRKKLALFVVVAALAVLGGPSVPVDAGVGVCDVQYGRLCWGLIDWWNFTSSADAQYGEFRNTPLYENDGTDQGIAVAHGGTHTTALDFDSTVNERLLSFRWGSLPSYFTAAFWVKPDRVNVVQTLVSNVSENYSTVTIGNYGGLALQINASGHPQVVVYKDEKISTDTLTVTHAGTAMSVGTWYLVVYKVSPYGPYGAAQACMSLSTGAGSAGAFECGTLTYNQKPATGDLIVGARMGGVEFFDGGMDTFGLWARAWDQDDVDAYWKSGNGRMFPFRPTD